MCLLCERSRKICKRFKGEKSVIYIARAEEKDAKLLTDIKVRALEHEVFMRYGRMRRGISLYDVIETETVLMKKYQVYKIVHNNKIIGGFFLDNYEENKMRVEDLAIEPKYQGRGYGLQVLQMVEEVHPDVKEWSLSTLAHSSSNQQMYEKAGYVEIDRDEEEVQYRKVIAG